MGTLWRIAGVTFALDQITKVFVLHVLGLMSRGVVDVVPPFLTFRMAWNQGINFGLFANSAETTRWILIAVALVISVWIAIWMHRERPGYWGQVSGGLLIGGALGNVIDRFVYGAVADFLNMTCCGIENPYSFNVADIAIFLGAVGLILFTGKSKTA
ncbi:Lipoprotein signal peptidase [Rhodobacteraceae bacterium THAF1]|uniref:signal peptidase II n=1 Tax=Palleronia sp. THAF1 TaxID=2587842 RepID=UPI000F3DBE4D|nr:signal peptidase II [Palleronia sp. THAF1]QFU09873.1 Lipoprotein signal peptidase [Palleronia sp. THAF1]VDC17224.1 Lipoprotein signal peptidase [Rhodobacteraceae bacterium THAF1]